jgi:hypothetical protein
VRLQRARPFFGNSFKPIFVGAFRHHHGRVVLEGRFTMFLFSKVFMTVWLTLALAFTVVAVTVSLRTAADAPGQRDVTALFLPLIPLGFLVLGIGFVRFCWWLSRNDMSYLAALIQEALSPRTANHGLASSLPTRGWRCPGCGEHLEPQFSGCWKCGASYRD